MGYIDIGRCLDSNFVHMLLWPIPKLKKKPKKPLPFPALEMVSLIYQIYNLIDNSFNLGMIFVLTFCANNLEQFEI